MPHLAKQDIEALRKSRTISLRVVAPGMLFAMSGFHLIMCLVGLRLTSQLAETGGYTFGDVWRQWIDGIDIAATYPGVLMKAIERLSMSAFQIGLVFAFLILGIAAVIQNRRNRRIVDFIEEYEKQKA